MTAIQIDGSKQIRDLTVGNVQIATGANIALNKLEKIPLVIDGSKVPIADQTYGGFKITNLGPAVGDNDAATLGQVKAWMNGFDVKASCKAATTGSETYSLSGGSVTNLASTTVDGVTLVFGDRLLIKNAPVAGTAGVPDVGISGSTAPGNGIYKVTSTAGNLGVQRADDADTAGNTAVIGGADVTAGMTTWVTEGSALVQDTQWVLTTNDPVIALGTTQLTFSNMSSSPLTFSGGLSKSGNQVTRLDFTGGDVTTTGNGVIANIVSGAVTFAKMANLAANTVIGNTTGSPAVPTAVSLLSTPTASAVVQRDANANGRFNNIIENFFPITSGSTGGLTTLAVTTPKTIRVTGVAGHTITMPAANSGGMLLGQQYVIINRSTAAIAINASGGGLILSMAANSFTTATLTDISSTAGVWDFAYSSAGGTGTLNAITVQTQNGFQGTASGSPTSDITLQTTVTSGKMIKASSGALVAATAGVDYIDPTVGVVTRETPLETPSGGVSAFTLAYPPKVGTEHVYLNGLLQDAGGQDYSLSGNIVTFSLPYPAPGDKIRVSYLK